MEITPETTPELWRECVRVLPCEPTPEVMTEVSPQEGVESAGEISAELPEERPREITVERQPEELREHMPETAVVGTPQRTVEAAGERKPYPMVEKAGAPTVEPEVEGATAGMTEPVPEVAADEGEKTGGLAVAGSTQFEPDHPRHGRAGRKLRPHRDELNGIRDDGTRTINRGIKLFDLRIWVSW
ncbi:hypothetical protein [Rhodococcus sp. WY5]|uniref:hypothetical protein n=1 Tax=Rhodococcus sp. WY5 TaxID=2708349 RepID=UPI001BDE5C8F|nr:hypothetical protein [Rhodococcus sp. WY5]